MNRHFFALLISFFIFKATPSFAQQKKIIVAVAANMQYCFKELKNEFEKTNPILVDDVVGASGNLTRQIMQGAPFDVFISADTKYPSTIFQNHFAVEKPKVYARGVLVLWTTNPGLQLQNNLQFLLSDKIKSIALANSKIAPYGTAAIAVLKKYNLFDKLKNKLVFGESISQTSQFIASRNADIGFTAKAVVLSDEMKNKGKWIELNHEDYAPILQSAVLLKYGSENHSVEARKFYEFLFSEKAKDIYKKYGYIN